MDTTVTGIGSVVVAELRAAGYMESTIGQYKKSIKALACFAEEHGGVYTPALGTAFASMTEQCLKPVDGTREAYPPELSE